jgi:hypothetical protein
MLAKWLPLALHQPCNWPDTVCAGPAHQAGQRRHAAHSHLKVWPHTFDDACMPSLCQH